MGMFEVESWAANKAADKLSKQLFTGNKKKLNLDENNVQQSSRNPDKGEKTDCLEKRKKRKHSNLEDDQELNSNIKQRKIAQTSSGKPKENILAKETNKQKKKSANYSKVKNAQTAKSPRNKYKHLALKKTEMVEGGNSVSNTEDTRELPAEKSASRFEKGDKKNGNGQSVTETLSSQVTKKNKCQGEISTEGKIHIQDEKKTIAKTTSPVKENKKKRKRKKKNNPMKNKYRHLIKKETIDEKKGEGITDVNTHKIESSDDKKVKKKCKNKGKSEDTRKSEDKRKSKECDKKRKFDEKKLSSPIEDILPSKRTKSECSLKQRMNLKLNAARFRYLNEQLYTQTGAESLNLFQDDMEAFQVYHDGFQSQVLKWPHHPLNTIVKYISTRSPSLIVADFGCGDARLAQTVPNKVHSFDFVALNKFVTPCDMSKVPIPDKSVDVAVFCLSLMGTNLADYLKEANRVLKMGGILKVAEVHSRFQSLESFIEQLKCLGFTLLHQNTSNKMFLLVDFKKTSKPTGPTPPLTLMPCVYKKR